MHRGPREIRVSKEILVHKGHLVVVVLGLRVLRVIKEILEHRFQKVIPVFWVQKETRVTKEILVHRVHRVHRGHLVVVLQTFQQCYY